MCFGHNHVHFFDISTSETVATLKCFVHVDFQMCFGPQSRALFRHLYFQNWSDTEVFVHVDFQMCFAPQQRTLFRHLNFQNWSDTEVFRTFWLQNVLRATTAYTFAKSQLPNVLWTGQFFTIFTSKCVSRHNSVQFFDISTGKSCPNRTCFDTFYLQTCFAPQRRALFRHLNFQSAPRPTVFDTFHFEMCFACHTSVQFCMSHLRRCLGIRRFSEPTFRPSGATEHWKNTVFRSFPTLSRTCIFSLLNFSIAYLLTSELLPGCVLFHLSIFSEA